MYIRAFMQILFNFIQKVSVQVLCTKLRNLADGRVKEQYVRLTTEREDGTVCLCLGAWGVAIMESQSE